VLVVGAGSGVGQAAMQIARLYHARTVVTAGRAEKLERARELGAFEAVNHSTEDVAAAVRKVTNRRGVDVVVEPRPRRAAGNLWRHNRLRRPAGLRFLFGRQLSLLGSYMGLKSELIRASLFFFDGRLSPVVDRVYPLAEVADARRRLESRQAFGKIVLQP
jgi:NADPH:quinone reductase-like Zn-dependent oxidoreductase